MSSKLETQYSGTQCQVSWKLSILVLNVKSVENSVFWYSMSSKLDTQYSGTQCQVSWKLSILVLNVK